MRRACEGHTPNLLFIQVPLPHYMSIVSMLLARPQNGCLTKARGAVAMESLPAACAEVIPALHPVPSEP